jgi:uncharacterized protein
MMDLTPKLAEGASLIASYGEGGFTINGHHREGNIFVRPLSVTPWSATEITEASLTALLEASGPIEILLIGTGKTHIFVPPSVRQSLKSRFSLSLETMDTGAACRTFNILLTEGRDVAAALIAI